MDHITFDTLIFSLTFNLQFPMILFYYNIPFIFTFITLLH